MEENKLILSEATWKVCKYFKLESMVPAPIKTKIG